MVQNNQPLCFIPIDAIGFLLYRFRQFKSGMDIRNYHHPILIEGADPVFAIHGIGDGDNGVRVGMVYILERNESVNERFNGRSRGIWIGHGGPLNSDQIRVFDPFQLH